MSFLIGLLTVVLVLNCVLLIFLVLIQLPKKDAGAGLAFGGGATDALFGAGSGTVLTKITKWSTGVFFGLAIILSLFSSHIHKLQNSLVLPKDWQSQLAQPAATPAPVAPPPSSTTPAPAPVTPVAMPAASTNGLLNIPMPAPAVSNAPAAH
jgi:preprotein translocase subunit SecG